jgi:hypothetical protein
MLILKDPIVLRKVLFKEVPFTRILDHADTCLISGNLSASHDFYCDSGASTIHANGRKLIFEYASRSDLLTVSVKRQVDSVALEQLQMDIEISELEIRTLRQDLPQNRLKRLESKLFALASLHASLLTRLSAVQDPLERITLREKLTRTETDRSRIESQTSAIDPADETTACKLKRAMFKLDQLNLEFYELNEGGVLYSGELTMREF